VAHREFEKAFKRRFRKDKKMSYAQLVKYDDLKWEHRKPAVTTVESRREVAAVAKRTLDPTSYVKPPKTVEPQVLEASLLPLLRPLVPILGKGLRWGKGVLFPGVPAVGKTVGKAAGSPKAQAPLAAAGSVGRKTPAAGYIYGGAKKTREEARQKVSWGKILPIIATGAVAGATDVLIDQVLPLAGLGGDRQLAIPQQKGDLMPGGVPATYMPFNPDLIVSGWTTGTANFYRLMTGEIAVQKKNGVWKVYRPYRPVVVPRKWDAKAMSRVATALKRQRKTATKVLQLTGGVPKKTVKALPARSRMRALPAGGTNIVVD